MIGDCTILVPCQRSPSTWMQHGGRKNRRTCNNSTLYIHTEKVVNCHFLPLCCLLRPLAGGLLCLAELNPDILALDLAEFFF